MPVKTTKPSAEFNYMDLPGTTLHYIKTGSGPPLIIVPALASKMEQWAPLAQFMGQKFTAYFFELPGHGESTPYPERFQTHFVPGTVESFVDELGIDRFTLMGLSFGGLLALRTLDHLLPRIDQLVLLCPALSQKALTSSLQKQKIMKAIFTALRNSTLQKTAYDFITGDSTFHRAAIRISKFANIDQRILLGKDFKSFPQTTIDVLSESMLEILDLDYESPNGPFSLPCFFGMSQFDNLLDYDTTVGIVEDLFTNIHIEKFSLPYHQPPYPFTFEDYNEKFGHFLDNINQYAA
jgi:pimeloyl-ACP methyl ester carboxylesterase